MARSLRILCQRVREIPGRISSRRTAATAAVTLKAEEDARQQALVGSHGAIPVLQALDLKSMHRLFPDPHGSKDGSGWVPMIRQRGEWLCSEVRHEHCEHWSGRKSHDTQTRPAGIDAAVQQAGGISRNSTNRGGIKL